MRTNVYIDGFNLYYGAVKGTPYRWLDIARFCAVLLPRDTIQRIRYYTALVKPRPHDPDQAVRQATYLRALRTIPKLTIHEGHFLTHVVAMPSAVNPAMLVQVIKTEEKGSDVNLAAHLLRDGFTNDFDVAIVVSNDSDLLEPIRIVQAELGKPVGGPEPSKAPELGAETGSPVLQEHPANRAGPMPVSAANAGCWRGVQETGQLVVRFSFAAQAGLAVNS